VKRLAQRSGGFRVILQAIEDLAADRGSECPENAILNRLG